jgi:hypothetical protein
MIRPLSTAVIGIVLAMGAGCSKTGGVASITPQETTLQEVADLIRATTQANGRGPTKVADFDKVQSMYPQGYQAVKSGEVVVIWNTGVKGEGEVAKGGGSIIAYEKDAPNSGGYVLLSSGQIKKMTADEFKAAPKAK